MTRLRLWLSRHHHVAEQPTHPHTWWLLRCPCGSIRGVRIR